MSPEWSSAWCRSTSARVMESEPTGRHVDGRLVRGQRPSQGRGDLLARGTDRVLLGVTTRHPDLAAQRPHRRGVDHAADDRVVEGDELTVLGRVALEDDVRESLVVLIVELRR